MKRIHIRKPDIKGKFQKLRHLKKEDIKEYWHKKKLRREAILEKRRNSAFAKKMQPVYKIMNRFSLLLHVLYACLINLVIESISSHSFFFSFDLMPCSFLMVLFYVFLESNTSPFVNNPISRPLAEPYNGSLPLIPAR